MYTVRTCLLVTFVCSFSLAVFPPTTTHAQTTPNSLGNNVQIESLFSDTVVNQVFQLLALDCGVSGELKQFDVALDKLEVDVSPLFVQILRDGAPNPVRQTTLTNATRRYSERQKWLKKNGRALFGEETADRLMQKSQEDYSADVLRRINIRYQENALRGLARIGKPDTIPAIAEMAKRDAALEVLSRQAIAAINERK